MLARNPLSLSAFGDWCAKQSGYYHYPEACNCAVGQYAQIHEMTWNTLVNQHDWAVTANALASQEPWTFGALTERVRAYEAGGSMYPEHPPADEPTVHSRELEDA